MPLPTPPTPNLAQRLTEVVALGLGNPSRMLTPSRLTYDFDLRPPLGRTYRCRLVFERQKPPSFVVLSPNLHELAGGRTLPHIYPDKLGGVTLCLWWPKGREWTRAMRIRDTYLPWAIEWLTYFEDWLFSNDWRGGGVHTCTHTDWRPACAES